METGKFLPFFHEKVESRLKSTVYKSKIYKYEETAPGSIARRRKLSRRILASDFPLFLRGRSKGGRNEGRSVFGLGRRQARRTRSKTETLPA